MTGVAGEGRQGGWGGGGQRVKEQRSPCGAGACPQGGGLALAGL